MNNGKVRIYELSKELNLENRDILAYCEELNIAVKSHSSTITEAEATQIRSAAERRPVTHSSSSRPAPSPTAGGSAPPSAAKPLGARKPVKKQQILEIRRHHSTSSDAPKPPEQRPKPAMPEDEPAAASAPLRPPARPSVASPSDSEPGDREVHGIDQNGTAQPVPTELPKPIAPKPVAPKALREDISEPTTAPERPKPAMPLVEKPVVDPEPPVDESPSEPLELEEEENAPELIKPPSRPVAKTPSQPQSTASRPILKKNRTEPSDGQSAEIIRSREELTGRPKSPSTDDSRDVAADMEVRQKPMLKPKPTIELRKPTRAPKVGRDADSTDGDDTRDETDITAKPDLELQRPAPPRPPKRSKSRRDHEEDEEETPRAKSVKSKRRTQPLIDEDEDLDEVLNGDENGANQVSLSLARPPKPKGRPPQPKAPNTAQAQKKRSGGGSRENSRNNRRDRREQEQKDKRPEHIVLTDSLSVHDLAAVIGVPETEIIKTLFFKGIAANINQILDVPTAITVTEEFGITAETAEAEAEAKKVTDMIDVGDLESLQRRPPVVTIMGHVDHGKTTLLDSIRKTKVAQGEAGGITQHIGAYHVDMGEGDNAQQVVFLDTPGHEAFTAMRARGTRVTDIAVLVVAADDGVRPQTIEAISHAKAAEVPIVVAINKVDKEGAQTERVKQELTEYGLVPEEWGGNTIMVPVSAINGDNLDTLLEMILLVAEVEDLYANPDRPARGTVIEANLDKSRGPVATLLVQNGSLRVGDTLVAGSSFCKVRAMIDDRLQRVEAAYPSFAVEVLGLSEVPAAGDEFEVFREEKEARSVADSRKEQQRQSRLQQAMASRRVSLNTLSMQAQEGELKELNLVLKADVQGSVEAILGSLQQLPQQEVQLRVLLAAPGEVTETDVDLAAASNAVIIGFNTTLASGARQASDEAGVDVREYNIIYKLLEDIQGAMEGLLDPEMVEEPLGQVEVRAVFPVGKGAVAGCYVQSGKAIRNCRVRVRRGNEVVHEGNLDSLKRVKDDVKEVNAGYECGIGLDNFNRWEEGDIVETFKLVSKRRTLTV
ncbi:translation initiation factor IF-2 [Leptolyngbya sp. CCY15150]|uniref:translation initiation factor IF-2 n=1 Tax=Leptolyngbya sp. CCY15150 TaxID=2767772 RepID=UPI001951809C|nr:translation initiation factor IF-2 [Leptolyngbya sp. CCY15150]